jgi:hypothetical protein
MYQHISHQLSLRTLEELFGEFFGLRIGKSEIHLFKPLLARYYQGAQLQLMGKLLDGDVLHVDETEVRLRTGKGYVWVFAAFDRVVYMYRPTREGGFLQEILGEFTGVVVTDFYAAYDSLDCPQQKCLIHLLRDMNQALLDHPFDAELQSIVGPFGSLLRSIVATVDEHAKASTPRKICPEGNEVLPRHPLPEVPIRGGKCTSATANQEPRAAFHFFKVRWRTLEQ